MQSPYAYSTPVNHQQDPPDQSPRYAFSTNVKITPQSKFAASQPSPQEDNNLKDINPYLTEDIRNRLHIPIDDFFDLILQLPPAKINTRAQKQIDRTVKDKDFGKLWVQYLKVCSDPRKKEKDLYPILVKVLNNAVELMFRASPYPNIVFYDGSERVVRGSLTERKPDMYSLLGPSFISTIFPRVTVYWPELYYFLEVKRRAGRALDWGELINGQAPDGHPARSQSGSRTQPVNTRSSANQANPPVMSTNAPAGKGKRKRKTQPASPSAQIAPHRYNTRSHSAAGPQASTSAPEDGPSAQNQVNASVLLAEYTANRVHASNPSTPPQAESATRLDSDSDSDSDSENKKRRKVGQGTAIVVERAQDHVESEMPSLALPNDDAPADSAAQLVTETQLQCAGYGLEMLSAGALRYHSIGIIIDDDCMQLAYYDRSMIVLSEPVNLRDSGPRYLLATLYQLNNLPTTQRGLFAGAVPDPTSSSVTKVLPAIHPAINMNYQIAGDMSLPDVRDKAGAFPGCNAFFGCNLTLGPESDKDVMVTLELKDIVHRAHGLIGRGTTVIRAKCAPEWQTRWKLDSDEVVVKISFPGEKRTSEHEMYDKAMKKALELGDDHSWVSNHLPRILFQKTYENADDMPHSKLFAYLEGHKLNHLYEKRKLRITVHEVLRPLTDVKNFGECVQVLFDVLQIHRWLLDHPRILHRDISMGNIMFRRKDGKVYGVLNDFDLATELPPDTEPTSLERTGTKPYMSHQLFESMSQWSGGHLYRHDLEALFYVILILSCHYDKHALEMQLQEKPSADRPFRSWFAADNETVRKEKAAMLFQTRHHFAVTKFFLPFQTVLQKLVKAIRRGYFWAGDKDEDEDVDWDTLEDEFTYDIVKSAFMDVVGHSLLERYQNHLPLRRMDFVPVPKRQAESDEEDGQ